MLDLSFLGNFRTLGQELLFDCPNGCGKKLYVNPNKQAYMCMVCGWEKNNNLKFPGKGNYITLAKYSNQTLPEYTQVYSKQIDPDYLSPQTFQAYTKLFQNTEKLTVEDQEYLSKRGFHSNEPNCMSGSIAWKHIIKNKSTQYFTTSGRPSFLQSDKLLIPYYEKGLVMGLRARNMDSNSNAKYIWALNNKASLKVYNLDILEKHNIVIWTEGEFKALFATLSGFPTIATAGINIGHENLLYQFCKYKTKFVYICFDTEIKNSTSAKNVNYAYKRADLLLSKYDIPHKRIYLDSNNTKIDLDSYILKHGIEKTKQLFAFF